MPIWTADSHGIAWRLELERDRWLPGRLVGGHVTARAHGRGAEGRQVLLTLIGTESWQHEESSTDGEGRATTRVVTSTMDLPRVPVQLAGPITLGPDEERTWPFQVPVPPLGPASVDATVLGVAWSVEVKLDRPGFDSSIEAAVTILQPVALLRAGVVRVGQYALYPAADSAVDDLTASIQLDPMPLCAGEPFDGRVMLSAGDRRNLQEIRAEIRVHIQATVPHGCAETVVIWAATLAQASTISGDDTWDVNGILDGRPLPTIETRHGRTAASFHLILATAWARDPHLVRDVAIATTLEL